jgi:hypothetical protein
MVVYLTSDIDDDVASRRYRERVQGEGLSELRLTILYLGSESVEIGSTVYDYHRELNG